MVAEIDAEPRASRSTAYLRAFEEGHGPLSDEGLVLLVAHVREVIEGGDPPLGRISQ